MMKIGLNRVCSGRFEGILARRHHETCPALLRCGISRHMQGAMNDISNRLVRVHVPGRQSRGLHVALATAAGMTFERMRRFGAPMGILGPGAAPAALATEGAAVIAEFSILTPKGKPSPIHLPPRKL